MNKKNFNYIIYLFLMLYNTSIKYLLIKCYLLFFTIFTKFTAGKNIFLHFFFFFLVYKEQASIKC